MEEGLLKKKKNPKVQIQVSKRWTATAELALLPPQCAAVLRP